MSSEEWVLHLHKPIAYIRLSRVTEKNHDAVCVELYTKCTSVGGEWERRDRLHCVRFLCSVSIGMSNIFSVTAFTRVQLPPFSYPKPPPCTKHDHLTDFLHICLPVSPANDMFSVVKFFLWFSLTLSLWSRVLLRSLKFDYLSTGVGSLPISWSR
jgi:hypothetical protein